MKKAKKDMHIFNHLDEWEFFLSFATHAATALLELRMHERRTHSTAMVISAPQPSSPTCPSKTCTGIVIKTFRKPRSTPHPSPILRPQNLLTKNGTRTTEQLAMLGSHFLRPWDCG
eukprot:600848-Amphidinium_carterae.1